jgi:hypothetical protein
VASRCLRNHLFALVLAMIDEENETTALYKALYENSKAKREANRQGSAKMLESHKIPFLSLNNGAHLVIQDEAHTLIIDFWPGTGLWRVRHTRPEYRKRGVRKLISYLQNYLPS